MGAATQTGRKKRTQPVSHKPELDDTAVKSRREKNRQAQHVFRKRKQATEAAQVRRIRRLEEVVEEMSCVVIRVFDAVFETEALTTQHPSLVGCLDSAMARVLELAREVVDVDGDDAYSSLPSLTSHSSSSTPSEEGSKQEGSVDVTVLDDWNGEGDVYGEAAMMESDSQMMPLYAPQILDDGNPLLEFPTETSSSLSSFVGDGTITSHADPDKLPIVPADWQTTSTSIPPQTFGNGWSSRKDEPPSHINGPVVPPSPHTTNMLSSLGGFAQRLLETTVSHGYFSLLNAPVAAAAAAEVERSFGHTLRYRTREQLMDQLQWLLGPGREYMFRASGVTWGGKGGTRAEFPIGFRPEPKQPQEQGIDEDIGCGEDEYLTVAGVHDELQNLGAKLVDHDTIEIKISQPRASQPSSRLELSMDSLPAPPPYPASPSLAWAESEDAPSDSQSSGEPRNFFGFFLTQRRERNLTLRLNLTLLVSNLSRVSTCFVRGPGYPRHELGKVMQASVVTANWN